MSSFTNIRLFYLILFFNVYSLSLSANEHKKLPLSYLNVDGIHATDTGMVYAADGFTGSKIYSITADGITRDFADGLNGPIDIATDSSGNLYVTNFNNGKVSKVSPSGDVSEFAEVYEGPAGIVSDSEDNLYVAHYGTGIGTGDAVLKITPQGVVSVFSQGGALSAPVGLAIDEYGYIYTANFNDGIVLRISPAGEQEQIAQIESASGYAIGHLAYANKRLYATGIIDNSVYVIRKDGKVKVRKNFGAGIFPNGIAYDQFNNNLLVANAFTSISSLTKIKLKKKQQID